MDEAVGDELGADLISESWKLPRPEQTVQKYQKATSLTVHWVSLYIHLHQWMIV
jgi:hypothetical protein